MPTLALAMIVKDEEKNLARCLGSVKDIFDEIVVVDTGSLDRTKEVAKSFGATIHDFTWIDDFSAARNFSFSKVVSPWVMWLDGDDEMVPDDRLRLIELKKRLGDADAYLMAYNYAQDQQGKPLVRFYRHRILKNDGRLRWKCPIHEHLVIPPGFREAMTNVVVTHRRGMEAAIQDRGRNIRLLRKAVLDDPSNQRMRFYYGKELYSEGEFQECARVLEAYLSKGDWHENMVNAHHFLALAYSAVKEMDKAIDACIRGIRLDPRWSEFYCVIGQIYYDRGDWSRAAQWFEIARRMPVPPTWGTVMMESYTWMPVDRLTKCYAEMGEWNRAYEANETALMHLPSDTRMGFNREFLRDKLFDRLSERPVRLNLGSGAKHEPSFRNCDYYPGPEVEFSLDLAMLPWRDATLHAIHSEHALEHSQSHYIARDALREWARALRHGGRLTLKVPDVELCCKAFLGEADRPRRQGERWTPKEWYLYTIYGIQQSQGAEPPEGQYHRTGFSKLELRRLLEESGFQVEKVENYDGWGTPSIDVRAVQVRNPIKVRWLLRGLNEEDPSTRIRRLNVHRWLASQGAQSSVIQVHGAKDGKVVEKDEGHLFAELRDADVVVFSFFTEKDRRVMDMLRRAGVSVVADYNEDLAGAHPEIAECLKSATLIVVCSTALAEKCRAYGRTEVIPDAYEEIAAAP
jgi:glycosyltransferase involved in cell wall biosynthesis/predicted SAM-dependent methyltransferase